MPGTELVLRQLKLNAELASREQRSRLQGTELVPCELMPHTELVSSKLQCVRDQPWCHTKGVSVNHIEVLPKEWGAALLCQALN